MYSYFILAPMKVVLFASIMFLVCAISFAKDVVIFEFYNKEGKNIPSASVGVLKSIMQFAKYYPGANIRESSFDVRGRDVKELSKVVSGYDNYIVGYYTFKNNVYTYEVSIYDNQGSLLTSFSVRSEDLFEIADGIMQKIFSFYSGKAVGFARIVVNVNLDIQSTYTIFLNDQVLSSVEGRTNILVKILSRTPYSVIVRNDVTKEIVFNKSIILTDNEETILNVFKEEPKETQTILQPTIQVRDEEKMKSSVLMAIRTSIERRDIFNDEVFKVMKEDAKILDYQTRKDTYYRYSISILGMIGASVLNIIPGLGSLVIEDMGGVAISILSPYATLVILSALDNRVRQETILGGLLGLLVIGGYAYNIVRPFIYASWWNSRLEEMLNLKENVSLSLDFQRVSLNIRF